MRLAVLLAAVLLLTGCGARSTGSFGDVKLAVGAKPDADDVGIYLASARGYDTGEGVELVLASDHARADLYVMTGEQLRRTPDRVGVMGIVQPDKRVVAVARRTLEEDREMVEAAVRALQRGYLQAQIEPDEAVQVMAAAVPGLDAAAVAAQLETAAVSWTAGAPFLGAVPAGKAFDRTVAVPQVANG